MVASRTVASASRCLGTALLALALIAADDPRPELIELQLDGELDTALSELEQIREQNPELSERLSLDYLRGHLLDRLERQPEAIEAFAVAMTSSPELEGHIRYRLAVDRLRADEAEAAAGLLVTMLAHEPPPDLVGTAIALLNRAMARGANCRLLDNWQDWGLDRSQSRRLQASLVDCRSHATPSSEDIEYWTTILRSRRNDETARRAAGQLARAPVESLDPATLVQVGLTFFEHREFERAIPYLEAAGEDPVGATRTIRGIAEDDVRYALARSFFWLTDYARAIELFDAQGRSSTDSRAAARALFQSGRSHALAGDWDGAVARYGETVDIDPTGPWAAAALISSLRLEWRQGREDSALASLSRLLKVNRWRSTLERAALFLAASDVVTQRTDRAGDWLAMARRAARRQTPEISYWSGRLAELQGKSAEALAEYATLLSAHPYHPLAEGARTRLRSETLRESTREMASRLAASSRSQDLLRALQLLDRDHPDYETTVSRLRDRWLGSSGARSMIDPGGPAVDTWSLWRTEPRNSDQRLLALGIAEAYSADLRRVFPVGDTRLALSGSQILSGSGLHRRSLYYAEIVGQRVPSGLPERLLADRFRQLLYPRPFDFQIEHQARRFGVDPDLLRAVIREESRFDPEAISAASARGLTQFVLPTARRVGSRIGLSELDAWDLHDPEIAITLGAAYLSELDRRFDGRPLRAIAAYNAGEDQARLWQAYCFSDEPEEYLTKVGFRQTRAYLAKVGSSRARYREIYAQAPVRYPAAEPRWSRTGGNDS